MYLKTEKALDLSLMDNTRTVNSSPAPCLDFFLIVYFHSSMVFDLIRSTLSNYYLGLK